MTHYRPTHFDRLPKDYILKPRKGVDPYVFSDDIAIAVDVALATRRPLLVSGNPGSGKSRLADAVAAVQGWSLLTRTLTSRTRLESLTVEVDQLRRLNDAQARGEDGGIKPDAYYLNPGLFWWAFQPDSARRRGLSEQAALDHRVDIPYPGTERDLSGSQPMVLLIDEIDKAEPDLPNDLLEPLDRGRFDLPEGHRVDGRSCIAAPQEHRLLTIITTNGERELPQAFLRRCVMLELPDPRPADLVRIGLRHIPKGDQPRMEKIAERFEDFRDKADRLGRRPPGTAEFLDAVRACEELGIAVSDEPGSVWQRIESAILIKDSGA